MHASLLGILTILLAGGEAAPPGAPGVRVMSIEHRLIVRVPVRPRAFGRLRWEEKKGPKCFPVRAIAGAFLSAPDSIDFVLRNRQRVRARFDSDCDGLDFYGNLYLQPEDDMVCAKRDVIRSRVGGTCEISRFRSLVPYLVEDE